MYEKALSLISRNMGSFTNRHVLQTYVILIAD